MPDGKGAQLPAAAPRSGSAVDVFAGAPVNLEASWRRCVDRYRFDPTSKQRIVVLSSSELREHCEPFEQTLAAAEEELDYIGGPLSDVGFIASVSNMAGLILHYRTDPDSNVDIERAGSLWGEGIAGTNGVGTCIIERRPTDVQGTQHFFRDFSALSCTSAPILSPDSAMVGVLNFATANPDVDPSTFRLASGLVRRVAERLSNRLFRMAFRDGIILSGRSGTQGPVLFALDREHFIVGANHAARNWLNWQDGALRPAELWTIFDRDPDTLSRVAASGGTISLRRAGRDSLFAIETPSAFAPAPQRPARQSPGAPSPAAPVKPAARSSTHARADAPPNVEECVGSTATAQSQFKLLKRVYGRGLPVLILGETGTGKDTLARALHQEGGRAERAYVAFNCAAVPETLIDSELFGYGVGAFTGARREGSPGRLIEADGGTLFLDEIGDMPLVLQTRLLRVLESGEVSPLGSGKTRTIDVQIIAATNQNLKTRVAQGLFREDLYYRLAGVVIQLQPLRDREDFAQLAQRMLDRVAGGEDVRLSDEALARLARHRWPGNARELKFVLQRAAQICEGGWIRPEDLMLDDEVPRGPESVVPDCAPRPAPTARDSIHAAERTAIADALAKCAGDVVKTADALKISRATLYRKMRQHNLRPQRYVDYDLH